MYLYLAIICAIGQIVFIFLLNKTGRKEALEETENNLSEVFKNLDKESRKEVLLNANLNKDEMILLVNNQTKNSAIDIISTTIKEFEIIQNDLDKKDESLDEIKTTTTNIDNRISDFNNYVNPNEFIIDLHLTMTSKYDSILDYVNVANNKRFRIWITFCQDGIEMHTYIDFHDKWQNVNKYTGIDVTSIPYAISYADISLYINNSKLELEKTVPTIAKRKFKSNKPIDFKLHYSNFNDLTLYSRDAFFRIKNIDGIIYKPINTKSENSKIPNPGFKRLMEYSMPDLKENKLILTGSFKLN